MSLARLFLDLRGIKERGDDCRRSDTHGDTRLDQLAAALLACAVEFVFAVRHELISMASMRYWEAP